MEQWELVAREQVRQTLSAYNFAGDRGRLDDLGRCFTDDGDLVLHDGAVLHGPAGIAAGLAELLDARTGRGDPEGEHSPGPMNHHVSSLHFRSVSATEIVTRSYFAVFTAAGVDHWGRYHDRLLPSGDGWLLQERRVVTDGFAEGSRFAPT